MKTTGGRISLFAVTAVFMAFSLLLAGPAAFAQSSVNLELTFPAGKSPKVFTEGWVFGARCIVNPGLPNEQDISGSVSWKGTGMFMPAQGSLSRPVFTNPGMNTIILSAVVDGQQIEKSFSVEAVSPYRIVRDNIIPIYVGVSHQSRGICAHGCPACPHPVVGPIITGSPNVTVFGLPAARVGDTGIAAACCGPNTFEIVEGDPNVLIDGRPAARVGDKTKHCGGIGEIIPPVGSFLVLFQVTMPEVREEKKPRRKEGESDQEWVSRKQLEYKSMTYNDFVFKEIPLEKTPFIIRVSGEAKVTKYLLGDFKFHSNWAMKISAQGQVDGQGSVKFDGSILLKVIGVYIKFDDIKEFHPILKDIDHENVIEFARSDGVSFINEKGATGTVGPLSKDWSQQDKVDAVELSKKFNTYFDCFIAHVVYSPRELQKIEIFRKFRDKVLKKSAAGFHIIRLYYEYGPQFAWSLRRHSEFIPAVRFWLDRIAALIENFDLEDPGVRENLSSWVLWIDRAASLFFRQGASDGLGQLNRFFLPGLWEKSAVK